MKSCKLAVLSFKKFALRIGFKASAGNFCMMGAESCCRQFAWICTLLQGCFGMGRERVLKGGLK